MKRPASKKKNESGTAELEVLRQGIDALDAQLVCLINQRARHAKRIGEIKARDGLKPYNPSRETEVYRRVLAHNNKGPLPDAAVRAIYREIMSATIALEHPTRVAFAPGPAGTFTHQAARMKFGASVEYLPMRDIRDVFLAVSRGRADYGVIPIENSTEGGINQSIDMFAETRLKIASEIYLPIQQNLLSRSPLKDIRVVYSHAQPFAQCRVWLQGHLGSAERREVSSTMVAVEQALKERGSAAIAGPLAAEICNIPVAAEHIEDSPDNTTRFFVVAERGADPTGSDKTSLLISVQDAPGALLRLLQPFYKHGLNLSRIESRPSRRRPWEYNFFVDLAGHAADAPVRAALKELEGQVKHIEVLGSYPAAERRPAPSRARSRK